MAFANNDIVTVDQGALSINGVLGPLVQPQPPFFGRVTSDSDQTALSVLWQNGHLETGIQGDTLDLIGDPDALEVSRLQGFFVKVGADPDTDSSLWESPEYQGVIVSMYTRDATASGVASATLSLMFTNTHTYREVFSADLIPVPGR